MEVLQQIRERKDREQKELEQQVKNSPKNFSATIFFPQHTQLAAEESGEVEGRQKEVKDKAVQRQIEMMKEKFKQKFKQKSEL